MSRAASTISSSPALLVPLAVDVLVLTDSALTDWAWSWSAPNYGLVRFFEPPVPILAAQPPQLITPAGQPGHTGTLLRWALPDALTAAGSADDTTGTLTFPAIPNRWLIQRRAAGASADTASWILASDYLGGSGTSFPVGTTASTLGMCWELSAWPGEAALPAGLQPPLTALGAGDPSFAASVPHLQHILAFHDPLADTPPGALSYFVAGWYGGAVPDPLNSGWTSVDEWTALASSLGWSVGDDPTIAEAAAAAWAVAHGQTTDPTDPRTTLPSRTVCHGLISSITWPGPTAVALSGAPTVSPDDPATTPVVTIAHTAADALATVVATAAGAQSTPVAEAVTALLGDLLPLLDEADGADQLAVALQSSWFQQLPGGTVWQLDEPEQPQDPTGSAATPLTATQTQLIDALNDAQADLDAAARLLATRQWAVYASWWKLQYVTRTGSNPIPNAIPVLQAALDATGTQASAAIAAWQNAEQACIAANTALSAKLGPLVLRQLPRPAFWRPNDPLVMIQGVGRSYAHGEDGRYTEDGSLFCRLTGQTIAALQVAGTGTRVTGGMLGLAALDVPDGPAETNDLAVEAFFLDPANAAQIAATADPAAPPAASVVAAQQTLMWNALSDVPLDQQTLAEAAGLASEYGSVAVPSKIAVTYWAPPWAPLYLDWAVSYYPTGVAQTGWTFPSVNATDSLQDQTAQWSGTRPQTEVALKGRALLTPQATDALAARLIALVTEYGSDPEVAPYLADLNAAIEYLHDAAVLCQGLSGFTDQLQQRDPGLVAPPDRGVLGQWLTPDGAPAFQPPTAPSPASGVPFDPVSGGFIGLQTLWVVDAFGQRYDVLANLQDNPPPQGDQLGPDLGSSIGSGLAALRPRLSQPSRLQLRFLDATDNNQIVGDHAAADPVCGWLIPNRLDNGLLVYDADGVLHGELIVERNTASWLPSPDEVPAQAQSAAPSLANPSLQTLVDAILGNANSGGALMDLLTTIRAASWAIAPTAPSSGQLSALVGFPVAVVRAQLLLELYGAPATSQLWTTTGHDDDGGMSAATITVRLGSARLYSDGLIGAVADDDPGHLRSPYGPSANGYVTTATHTVQVNQPLDLTLLAHPHGVIHAFTGLLPPVVASLPPTDQTAPLDAMEVTFRSGPLVTPVGGVTAPVPAFGRGDWSWLQYDTSAAPARARPLLPADATAVLLDTPPTLNDGWLRLTLTAQATTLTYAVTPGAVAVGSDTSPAAAAITITAYNGSAAPVASPTIHITFTVGSDSDALTADPDLIQASAVPAAWTVHPDGTGLGVFTATADPAVPLDPGAVLSFAFNGIPVANSLGLVTIGIDETVAAATTHADLYLEKTPPP